MKPWLIFTLFVLASLFYLSPEIAAGIRKYLRCRRIKAIRKARKLTDSAEAMKKFARARAEARKRELESYIRRRPDYIFLQVANKFYSGTLIKMEGSKLQERIETYTEFDRNSQAIAVWKIRIKKSYDPY